MAAPSPADSLVSVVIPTIGRPQLVGRAIRSALAQSLAPLEVIVVVDGPDADTLAVVRAMPGPGLRVVALPERHGLGGARNAGIQQARAPWIALLDDDDEWLPSKLASQLDTARRSNHPSPIVACRFIDRRPHGDLVLPRRLPLPHEAVSEYVFCRRRLLVGEGVVLPSTMLAPKSLFAQVPFRYAAFAHEGSDWLLRAVRLAGVGLEFVAAPEPLAIRHAETVQTRMSNTTDWRTSLAWAREHADLLTRRAHAAFLLNRVSPEARRVRAARGFWLLLLEAFRRGRPTGTDVLTHLIFWLVPGRARFRLGALLSRPFSSTAGRAARL
jgi:glycosyltransferase involved in cell wall biosynthesis